MCASGAFMAADWIWTLWPNRSESI